MYIIQKLSDSGRTSELKASSTKFGIDKNVTQVRKDCEDKWVRTLHCQYPYGCNDRIDSLKDKWMFNCEFAKFFSPKSQRRRSWGRSNSNQPDVRSIVNSLLDVLKEDFDSSCIMILKRLLFPLRKSYLIKIRDLYLKEVFTDNILKHEALYRHAHFVITDLLSYKIKPFNSSNNKMNSKRKKDRVLYKISFVNKALDMINLPQIFRNKVLKSFVNFCNIKEPSVLYSSRASIGSKLFNYNETVENFISLDNVSCVCSEYCNFVNNDCGHVVTGDVTIFSNEDLRELLLKGPKFREPARLDFDRAKKTILDNLESFIKSWADKEHFNTSCFEGWKSKFIELLESSFCNLKLKYRTRVRTCDSVFDDPSASKELDFFHKHFVLCPVDKASKNIAIICKKYYMNTLMHECMNNTLSYCNIKNISIDDICTGIKDFMSKDMKINVSNGDNRLPHIVLFPKFHKPKLSQRFVVSYANCTIKPLASQITLGLKAVYKKVISYSNMIFKVTGINRNWIIDNNDPLLNCFTNTDFARNIQTYDFSTSCIPILTILI